MFQKTQKIWLDGKMVRWEDGNVHLLTHSLHYGVGAFEGIRYYDCGGHSAVFRLREHVRRFEDSCKILAMKMPFTQQQIFDACIETAKVNGLKEGYLRPLAFISDGPGAGVWAYENPVRVAILTWGWGAYLGKEGIETGIKAKTSSYSRHHRNVGMMRAKVTGQYFNSVLAKREAKMAGADEAILLDHEGFVAEGTGENIFLVRDGIVKTPAFGAILPGITRETIMTICREEGRTVEETHLTRDEFYIADEVFFTGTAAEVTPVREINGRVIGEGKPGPITKHLQKTYQDLVHGKIAKHKEWLSPI